MLETPKKSTTLEVLEILRKRIELTELDQSIYYNLQKGYNGELRFSSFLKEELRQDYIVLYDVLLEKANSYFQIDCMIICEEEIHLLDIKNFHDDYYFQGKDFYRVKTGKRAKNPLHQLQRCEDLLRDFLIRSHFNYTIKSYIVFIHPEFTLYQAPLQLNIILPTQVRRFIRKLNQAPVRITQKEQELAQMLRQEHIQENHYEKLPVYDLKELKKGLICLRLHCDGLMKINGRGKLKCEKCDTKESVESSVLRTVIEFSVLFPNKKITTTRICEWCGGAVSKKMVRRILSKYLCLRGKSKLSHFVFW